MSTVLLKNKKNRLLGLGHPRTGTGYTSALLTSWGLKVGHEFNKEDGIVAWQFVNSNFAIFKHLPLYAEYDLVIYNVRDPLTAIPSVVFTEDTVKRSLKYRTRVLGYSLTNNPIENAIRSLVHYDDMVCNKRPEITFRIEDQANDLFIFLKQYFPQISFSEVTKKVNSRPHELITDLSDQLDLVSPEYMDRLRAYCDKHGYRFDK